LRSLDKTLDEIFDIQPTFRRFDEADNCFRRSRSEPSSPFSRDPTVRRWSALERRRRGLPGYGVEDYALTDAGWHVQRAGGLYRPPEGNPRVRAAPPGLRLEVADPAEMSRRVKKVARILGAGLAGVARFDERWIYAGRESPEWAQWVVALAFEMDYELVGTSPAATAGGAWGLGYSHMAEVANSLAEFIHRLGYNARASGNDTGLSIPYAVAAGLGELGRNGLLITPQYGPRVRLAKVFTDLPLEPDRPIEFGVQKVCRACKKCAERCPAQCIPYGDPTMEGYNRSNNPGMRKWYVDAEKCLKFWRDNASPCGNCISACPYNKRYEKWRHRLARDLAPLAPFLFIRLDNTLGYGKHRSAEEWWKTP